MPSAIRRSLISLDMANTLMSPARRAQTRKRNTKGGCARHGTVYTPGMHDVRTILEQAIASYGSEPKFAAVVGCSQNAIWSAKRANRITAELANRIHAATQGAVSRSDLRPDLWPQEGER